VSVRVYVWMYECVPFCACVFMLVHASMNLHHVSEVCVQVILQPIRVRIGIAARTSLVHVYVCTHFMYLYMRVDLHMLYIPSVNDGGT
jgi:hypothetical protein